MANTRSSPKDAAAAAEADRNKRSSRRLVASAAAAESAEVPRGTSSRANKTAKSPNGSPKDAATVAVEADRNKRSSRRLVASAAEQVEVEFDRGPIGLVMTSVGYDGKALLEGDTSADVPGAYLLVKRVIERSQASRMLATRTSGLVGLAVTAIAGKPVSGLTYNQALGIVQAAQRPFTLGSCRFGFIDWGPNI